LFYLGLFGIFSSPSAFAQSYPPGFNDELIVGSLNVPTAFTFDPAGRMYIAEQSGAIRIFEDDALLPDPAITIPVEAFDEQGLLGLALHPDFPAPPYLYVFYTPFTGNQTGNTNQVSRFTVGATTIDPASEVVLLPNIPAGLGFHLGGCVRFGGDGNLYISTGDTGWSTPYPQDLSLLQGKILRIRPDGTIPPNNPFVGVPGARPEIYQWGLRNPFRFSFQPGGSTPFIGDVGFESWEEIDKGVPGANFGWPICEGSCIPPNPNFVNPIYQYSHALGSAAIVGNLFYEGSHFPAQYAGNYFFFDHSRGHLGRMILDANNQVVSVTMPFLETASSGWLSGPVDLVLGPEGALYYCTYFPGEIRRIFYTGSGNRNPTAIAAANPQAGYPPLFVQFSSAGTYDVDGNPLTYDWNFGDGSPHSTAPNPTHTYNANGVYPATLKASDGLGGVDTSLPVTVTVGKPAAGAHDSFPHCGLEVRCRRPRVVLGIGHRSRGRTARRFRPALARPPASLESHSPGDSGLRRQRGKLHAKQPRRRSGRHFLSDHVVGRRFRRASQRSVRGCAPRFGLQHRNAHLHRERQRPRCALGALRRAHFRVQRAERAL
jgi:glucose/arabinose dehydrogenase